MVDDDLWWVFCGNECEGQFLGPHLCAEDAEDETAHAGCDHDHMVFRMTLRQMAARLPVGWRYWSSGIYDPKWTPARALIRCPAYPVSSYLAWPNHMHALIELRETTCV